LAEHDTLIALLIDRVAVGLREGTEHMEKNKRGSPGEVLAIEQQNQKTTGGMAAMSTKARNKKVSIGLAIH